MKVNKKDNQKFMVLIMIVTCLVIMLVGAYIYISSVRRNLMDQAISNVLTVSQQQQQAFDNFIGRDRERIHSYAVEFSKCDSGDEAFIRNTMSLFGEVEANYTVFNLETGTYYSNMTRESLRMTPEELEVYSQFSGSGVRDPYIGVYSEDERFGYYECFEFADGVRGLVQKGYAFTKISDEFSLSFYDGQGFTYIVNRQGDILLRPLNDGGVYTGDNIFDMIDSSGGNEKSLEDFISALDRQETGTITFSTNEDNTEKFVYTYLPIESVDEWYMVSIVHQSAIMEETEKVINNSQSLVVVLVVIMIVFGVFSIMILRGQRNIAEKDREVEYQEKLFDIFSTYLAKNTDDVYMMISKRKRTMEYVSPNIKRVLGVSEIHELRGIFDQEYEDGNGIKSRVCDKMGQMEPGDALDVIDAEWVDPNTGKTRWFQEKIYCVSIQNAEKIVIYVSDRTKDQEIQNMMSTALEAAEVASKAKSMFLSSISHDIRTPMNAIMGLVTLLKQEADNPQYVLEYTQRIDAASQHLLGLINDVLDMNKIESGNASLNITEVNLPEIIDELNMIIRPQARARKQEFLIYTSPFACEHLLGDKTRINQILINVLSNAVKYTQEGGRIELSVRELPRLVEKYNRLEFVVKDNGQGMTEEYQKIIFSPFTREHETGTNKIQGTGLGMAITKSLVDLMGGSIRLESELGKGSTFTIELELREQEKKIDLEFWKKHNMSRMLVADDDIETCENVVRAMAEADVIVDYVADGDKVIQTVREAREKGAPYDLLLLDWQMPNMNGLEAARLVRKNYSRKIPILLFTAYDWADIEQEAIEIGVDHFYPKPFFMSSFKNAIEKIMNSKNGKKHADKGESSAVSGRSILVVEDIEVNRMILVKILDSRGASCEIAKNGQEAVEKFENSKPGQYDMILMDIQMPVMDGYEATRNIRGSSHPDAQTIPIIAMTANAFADDVRDALQAGMDAHVSKPVVLEKLEATILEVLNKKHM